MFQYEPFAKNWRICISGFFFLVDVGFCLHFSKIVLIQQKCYVEFSIIIIKFGLWDYHDLRMSQVLGILSSTFRYFSKIKKEAFLWVFSSQIPLQFFYFLCDLPLDSLLFSQILLHQEVEGFKCFGICSQKWSTIMRLWIWISSTIPQIEKHLIY